MKEFALKLSQGKIEEAAEMRQTILSSADKSAADELFEVVRQAVISYLKKGDVDMARKAKTIFSLPDEILEDSVQQAVLSSFYDGDLRKVRKIRDELPVDDELAAKIIEYGSTWGRQEKTLVLRAVFA